MFSDIIPYTFLHGINERGCRAVNEGECSLLHRFLETNEKLSEKDLPRVRKMFAALNRDKARVGDMIQSENGEWVKKEKK